MKKYTLTQDGFDHIRAQMQRRGLITGAATALIAGVVFAFIQATSEAANPLWTLGAFVLVCGLFFGATMLGVRRSVQRLEKFWDTFDLRLGEDRLSIRHEGTDKVTILRGEVERIGETPDEGLWVSTGVPAEDEDDDTGGLTVHIPKETKNYPEIKEKLGAWQPIEEVPTQAGPRVPIWAWIAVFAIAYALVLFVDLWWIVAPVGLVLVGVGTLVAVSILRNPNLEPGIKIGAALIALMILSVVLRVGVVLLQAFGGGVTPA